METVAFVACFTFTGQAIQKGKWPENLLCQNLPARPCCCTRCFQMRNCPWLASCEGSMEQSQVIAPPLYCSCCFFAAGKRKKVFCLLKKKVCFMGGAGGGRRGELLKCRIPVNIVASQDGIECQPGWLCSRVVKKLYYTLNASKYFQNSQGSIINTSAYTCTICM